MEGRGQERLLSVHVREQLPMFILCLTSLHVVYHDHLNNEFCFVCFSVCQYV